MGGEHGNHEDEEKCKKAFDEKETFCDTDVAVSTILQYTLKKYEEVVWSEYIWLTTRTSADSGENTNMSSEFTKRGKFVDYNLAYQHSRRMYPHGIRYRSVGQFFSVHSYGIMVQLQEVSNLETNVMIVARDKS